MLLELFFIQALFFWSVSTALYNLYFFNLLDFICSWCFYRLLLISSSRQINLVSKIIIFFCFVDDFNYYILFPINFLELCIIRCFLVRHTYSAHLGHLFSLHHHDYRWPWLLSFDSNFVHNRTVHRPSLQRLQWYPEALHERISLEGQHDTHSSWSASCWLTSCQLLANCLPQGQIPICRWSYIQLLTIISWYKLNFNNNIIIC